MKTSIHNQQIVFISAHLLPLYSARIQPLPQVPGALNEYIMEKERQIDILLAEIASFGDVPVVFGCDCNTTETNFGYRMLAESLTDSAHAAGKQPTIEGTKLHNTIYHLDYVWLNERVEVSAVYYVDDFGGSDHLPVFADLVIGN